MRIPKRVRVQEERAYARRHDIGHMDFPLNDKGQCPHCKRKPIPYKSSQYYYCFLCDRAYSMQSHAQIENWAWQKKEGVWWRKVRANS